MHLRELRGSRRTLRVLKVPLGELAGSRKHWNPGNLPEGTESSPAELFISAILISKSEYTTKIDTLFWDCFGLVLLVLGLFCRFCCFWFVFAFVTETLFPQKEERTRTATLPQSCHREGIEGSWNRHPSSGSRGYNSRSVEFFWMFVRLISSHSRWGIIIWVFKPRSYV